KLFLPEWGPDETGNAADANDDGRVDILDLLILLATWGVCPGTGAEMGNMATDGTGAAVVKPGLYLLTISPSSRQPVSTGGPIFFFTDPTEISGPDGPGGQGPIVDWQDNDGDGDGEGIQGSGTLDGEYKVVLTGCSFAAPPLNNGVPVDLVPGKCPSDFEPTLQFLDAAFVSDNNFNAMDVDPKTVRLRRADGVGGDVSVNFFKRLDVTAPFAGEVCNCTQDPPDRLDDLYMGFSTSEMVAVMNLLDGIPPGEFVDRVMILSGLTFDGLSVEGRDCLRVFGDIKP
ncbi:MAG: hypothetical protein HRT46_12720, partial [Deltaproteobacteria bacterium]|nr:hypothetical protein [Deltaproteobacteria bacterium]